MDLDDFYATGKSPAPGTYFSWTDLRCVRIRLWIRRCRYDNRLLRDLWPGWAYRGFFG